MRRVLAAVVAACWVSIAGAAVLSQKAGTLATFTGTGTGTDMISPEGADSVLFIYTTTGGGTLSLEVSTDGTTWAPVVDSPAAITNAANVAKSVSPPIGLYRATCSAHSSGTHTIKYRYYSTTR